MGRKVEIIQRQQEIIDEHNEIWNRVFKLMAENKLAAADQLVHNIDNSEFDTLQSEFESLGAEKSERTPSEHRESERSEEKNAAKQRQKHVKSKLKRVSFSNGETGTRSKGACRKSRRIGKCSLQGPPRLLCKT